MSSNSPLISSGHGFSFTSYRGLATSHLNLPVHSWSRWNMEIKIKVFVDNTSTPRRALSVDSVTCQRSKTKGDEWKPEVDRGETFEVLLEESYSLIFFLAIYDRGQPFFIFYHAACGLIEVGYVLRLSLRYQAILLMSEFCHPFYILYILNKIV